MAKALSSGKPYESLLHIYTILFVDKGENPCICDLERQQKALKPHKNALKALQRPFFPRIILQIFKFYLPLHSQNGDSINVEQVLKHGALVQSG